MLERRTTIRAFLGRFFHHEALQDDDDIFAAGFVDSMFAMQLVLFLEKEFGVAVEDADLDLDNFRSISAMDAFVGRKTDGVASGDGTPGVVVDSPSSADPTTP